jgi:hypothetical protein
MFPKRRLAALSAVISALAVVAPVASASIATIPPPPTSVATISPGVAIIPPAPLPTGSPVGCPDPNPATGCGVYQATYRSIDLSLLTYHHGVWFGSVVSPRR